MYGGKGGKKMAKKHAFCKYVTCRYIYKYKKRTFIFPGKSMKIYKRYINKYSTIEVVNVQFITDHLYLVSDGEEKNTVVCEVGRNDWTHLYTEYRYFTNCHFIHFICSVFRTPSVNKGKISPVGLAAFWAWVAMSPRNHLSCKPFSRYSMQLAVSGDMGSLRLRASPSYWSYGIISLTGFPGVLQTHHNYLLALKVTWNLHRFKTSRSMPKQHEEASDIVIIWKGLFVYITEMIDQREALWWQIYIREQVSSSDASKSCTAALRRVATISAPLWHLCRLRTNHLTFGQPRLELRAPG